MRTHAGRIEPHIAALRRFARALLREDRQEAEDLVQDTLERALAAWDRRRPGGDLRGWLYTILYNRFLTGEERRRREAPGELPQPPRSDAGRKGGFAHRDIVRAVAGLPEEERAVLLLSGLDQLSCAETARVMGVPIGIATARLPRARGRLRRHLDGEERPRSPLRIAAAEWPCNNISLQ